MTRIEHTAPPVTVIPRSDFVKDQAVGYCITVWKPEEKRTVRDRWTGKEFTTVEPPVHQYSCMRCEFSTINLDHMKEHLFHGEHPWCFSPFNNPYGHFTAVVIEGIETEGLTYREFLDKESST